MIFGLDDFLKLSNQLTLEMSLIIEIFFSLSG